MTNERILLIGDMDRQIQTALMQATPGAHVTSVNNYFDGIAELSSHTFTTVLASAEPIERRPEAAVKSLRQLAGDGRVLLFGHPTLEPLSRKMLDFGCDDYIISPASPAELQQMFGTPPLRLGPRADDGGSSEPLLTTPPSKIAQLMGLSLADILLDAVVAHPHDAPASAVKELNNQMGPTMQLVYSAASAKPPAVPDGMSMLSHAVRAGSEQTANLHLLIPRDEDEHAGRHFLAQLAHVMGKVATLEDRHNRLQKLAITDDLTGVYNGRYFRHFLTKIIEKARAMRFPVWLLLFDIDNFKKYNDQFGHCVGDEILKQTASLMKRCVRDHDLVARIGGDEFAVVFWEKEGPRQPRDPQTGPPARPPQTPRQILKRFQRLLSTQEFPGLGSAGRGVLTISGGLAVFPYDAQDVESLKAEADRRLVFGAKQAGKNSIFLVGNDEETPPA
jgi:GGDEF domain-containing protein